MLGGRGLLTLIAAWLVTGRRSYPRWLDTSLLVGWLLVAAAIVYLTLGPDPRDRLIPVTLALVVLWVLLMVVAIGGAVWVALGAWRQAREWSERLKHAQIRLRMNSGLTLKGASAGLPFAINVLLSLYRSRPRAESTAWLWHRVFRSLSNDPESWGATGVITADGSVEPVILERKLRASLNHPSLRNVLAPRQHEASALVVDQVAIQSVSAARAEVAKTEMPAGVRVGHAHGSQRLRVYQCRNLVQALMSVGNVGSRRQIFINVLALAASIVMLFAMPGIRSILLPPLAPWVSAQPSTSPYNVWLGVDSNSPESFFIVLESHFWANRRAAVQHYAGANGSVRAEINLRRLSHHEMNDEENGTFWVERRRFFLGRVFAPGERIGRYTFSYLTRRNHE